MKKKSSRSRINKSLNGIWCLSPPKIISFPSYTTAVCPSLACGLDFFILSKLISSSISKQLLEPCLLLLLPKIYEEFKTGKPEEILEYFTKNKEKQRGEFVVLVG